MDGTPHLERIGGNRRFDSLDEERLFSHLAAVATARGEAIGAVRPDGSVGWPWLLFDHTHLPMLSPSPPYSGASTFLPWSWS